MSDAPIQVSDLDIRYGHKRVVTGVSFSVPSGSVYGLLGRNGEGKTSIVRTVLGQQPASSGSTRLFGQDSWRRRRQVMARVAFVPETPQVAAHVRIGDLLRFMRRIRPRWDDGSARAQLRELGVDDGSAFGSLSRGQKTQLALITALASRPDLLICDDPTLGLDVVARRELLDRLIIELAENATTVLVTTHDLESFSGIVDRVGVLDRGRLLIDEELEVLRARFCRLEPESANLPAPDTLAAMRPLGRAMGPTREAVVVTDFDERLRPPGVKAVPLTLEEIFVAVTARREETARA